MSTSSRNNVLITPDIIAKESLRLLKNNLVAARLVNRGYTKEFAKVGDQISVKLPFRTRTASGRVLVKQPLVDKTTTIKIDKQEHFGMEIDVRDKTLSLEQFSDRYLKSGIVQLANVVDKSIIDCIRDSAFYNSGTPGTAMGINDVIYAEAYMDDVAVPNDGMRRLLLNTLDSANLQKDITGLYNADLVKTAMVKGYKGEISNFSTFKSQNLTAHTVGAYAGTPLVNGANQTGDTLITDGWTASVNGLLKKGDTFTIDGVFEINPQNYTSTGRLQAFTVTADVNSDASGNATIHITPSINDGTLTTVDGEGNNISTAAYKNVSKAPSDNASITVIGNASTAYRTNLAFHRDAVALVVPQIEIPESATIKARATDPDSGLSVLITGAYDVNEHSEITRVDVIWGVKSVYPELIHKIYSN